MRTNVWTKTGPEQSPDHPLPDDAAAINSAASSILIRTIAGLAQSEGVAVYGTIWLMEQLFDARLVSLDEMESAYGSMLDNQSRLPEREVARQLRRLKARP